MKLATLSLLFGSAAAFAPSKVSQSTTALHETQGDLKELAAKLNPAIKFFDPLGLSDANFWGKSKEETIGFIREAEVKHGRIAMFAFVGYLANANGITFPWSMQLDGTPFPQGLSPPEAWDAISDSGKLQIFLFVGFLEFWREIASDTHYMKGGKIGYFPAFDSKYIPGGALDLYDPFGFNKNRSEEAKAAGLVKEINNGRLAMLGIFGFLSAAKIDGSVPSLTGIIPHYDGEFMAPFTTSIFPHV
eukprot:CAMPEP_0197829958 /NCGR_PEP_ID=MMETSP1437-20131217/6506_1 /TAXON_ID=49252 ORGANISM="Eucampia antarctica, Strain CCMP1452" /NCGR_SAMPLE_ID=MMETSP1437 /ASSEMBLY_ACC=CAM_ASM_001096 /LENGTH=245 /DNA_ID=CAMNT_0043431997 /DNA_START=94 /DNA_END=831 /DNA_ORIENTATION=-